MRKYIISPKDPEGMTRHMANASGADIGKVKWNWTDIRLSRDAAPCSGEQELLDAIESRDFHRVDGMIMGADVSVGDMVVVSDGGIPRHGFICGNGIEWMVKPLKVRESNAIAYSILMRSGRVA